MHGGCKSSRTMHHPKKLDQPPRLKFKKLESPIVNGPPNLCAEKVMISPPSQNDSKNLDLSDKVKKKEILNDTKLYKLLHSNFIYLLETA